jgi:putative transposase
VFTVEKMCVILKISRSGYYDWTKRPMSKRKIETQGIIKVALKSYRECKGMCGLDKILKDVQESFPRCSRNRLYNIQKEYKLYSSRKRKYKATTNSHHKLPVAENILNQNFNVDNPAAVWVTDISYIGTGQGWLYLATVKDIFTKEIVGWATDDNMRTELCKRALNNAVMRNKPPKGVIHHSDRGVQYCSYDYQALLKKNNMVCSMSRKGNCFDNACAETFFSTIKCEMLYNNNYATREEARRDIFWYIEVFYNRRRRHQALGYLTPYQFKQKYQQKLAA